MCAMKEVNFFLNDAKLKESAKQFGQIIAMAPSNQHGYESSDNAMPSGQRIGESPRLCANGGCNFYGTSETKNLCSKCFRDSCLIDQSTEKVEKPSHAVASVTNITSLVQDLKLDKGLDNHGKSKKQCSCCKKRLRILNEFKCRCGNTHCLEHRLPEKHHCTFDYKSLGRNLLKKSNPIVKADKLQRI